MIAIEIKPIKEALIFMMTCSRLLGRAKGAAAVWILDTARPAGVSG